MSNRRDGPSKPSVVRPLPRRLFSIDSLRSQRSASDAESLSTASKPPGRHARTPSRSSSTSTLRVEDVGTSETGVDAAEERWTDVNLQDQSERGQAKDRGAGREFGARWKGRMTAPRPLTLDSSGEGQNNAEVDPSLPSPGRRRWDILRSHVLPSAGNSASTSTSTPSPIPRAATPGSSSTRSSTRTPPSTRPATPKGYRFGQRIFRQVVEQAREAVVDEHRKFAEDILQACWLAHFGDVPMRRVKPEREPSQGTIASTLHLPFGMSTGSLPIVSLPSVTVPSLSSLASARRPQSSHNLEDPRIPASVVPLSQVLQRIPVINRPRELPHEAQVLSALLVPFLGPNKGVEADPLDSEQYTATKAFENLCMEWHSTSCEVNLRRCLWCFDAASVPSAQQPIVIGLLSKLIFSSGLFMLDSPAALRTIYQGLYSLLRCVSSDASLLDWVRKYLGSVDDGSAGMPPVESFEKEYGVRWSSDDQELLDRRAVATESIVNMLQGGSESSRRWILHDALEANWPIPDQTARLTPLLSCIDAHRLKAFVTVASTLLFPSIGVDVSSQVADAAAIMRILHTRVLREVDLVLEKDATGIRSGIIQLALDLTCVQDFTDRAMLLEQIRGWLQDSASWKSSFDGALRNLIANAEWPAILRVLIAIVKTYPEDMRSSLVAVLLPLLHDRLMASAPEYPCEPLSEFLQLVSRAYPKVFFKPIFTCAASAKDLTIATQLSVLTCIARYMPDLWCRDADMMSVALMSDPVGAKARLHEDNVTWGRTRMGQLVLLLELIAFLQRVRRVNDVALAASAVRFAVALEARLGALIKAKEQTMLVPISQRLLLTVFFRETRLLTRSSKSASWHSSVVSWTLYELPDDDFESEEEQEIGASFDKLRALYAHALEAFEGGSKRRTTLFLSPSMDRQRSRGSGQNPAYELLVGRFSLVDSLHIPLRRIALPLLVLVSGLLSTQDYASLGPVLWHRCLDSCNSDVNVSASFLVMQCAERSPMQLLQAIEHDLSNDDARIRRAAIRRIEILCSWRTQLLSQDVILDKNYRRPFKLSRPPIHFVPTDIGSSLFVLEGDVYEFKDSHGHLLPLELRRRLADIGWDEEDRVEDPKTQWLKTPLSLLPTPQLSTLDDPADESTAFPESPNLSPDPSPKSSPSDKSSLLRRDSSNSGTKRRPVFVSELVALFPRVVSMVKDEDFEVASAARNLVVDLMRDDPSLLTRPIYQALSGNEHDLSYAADTVMAMLHVRPVLPPAIAHHLLNHLTGFLKSFIRQTGSAASLQSYAYSAPAIARLSTQVSKMSARDIRRAKVDMLLLPTGSLWFPPSAPQAPMFPRGVDNEQNPFEAIPSSLVWITMVRTSQNMMFLRLLEKDPQELKTVRKSLTRLVLPSMQVTSGEGFLQFASFKPRKRRVDSRPTAALNALSLTLACSYLLLTTRMFWSMSRHLSDRQEFAILVDGLNRVLITHGDDIGIVAHTMLAFMLASTRFKRIFIAGGTYALFMPAVIKVYCESEAHPGIRAAIEYAVNRFYAIHQEAFVFQSVDVISHMFMATDVDQPWLAKHVFALFSTLKNGTAPLAPDVAGIYDLNKLQEQENRMADVAEEVPQTFLASIRKVGIGRRQVTLVLPDQYEWKRLALDDFVRLFLTVIAHNPTIQRAERFLRSLRLLAPHFYNASHSSRTVLRDGIDALGAVFINTGAFKSKLPENSHNRPSDDFGYEVLVEDGGHELKQGLTPADSLGMQLDYMSLVVTFTQAGGELSPGTFLRFLELIKLTLRDSIVSGDRISVLLTDYLRTFLLREPAPSLKQVVLILTDVAPIVTAYSTSVNFAGVYDLLATLSANSLFASQPRFSQLVVTRYCRAGLEACEVAASEGWLLSLPSRMNIVRLINSAISLVGADIVGELEQHSPTYAFLSGVLLPLVLIAKTSADLLAGSQWTEGWRRRDVLSRAWIRLLSYTLAACQNPAAPTKFAANSSERRKSQDIRSVSSSNESVMAFSVALQVLKVIVIRAEDDLSAALPRVWFHISSVLRSLLADGDALFAQKLDEYSEPPSPSQSPRKGSFSSAQDQKPLLPSVASGHSMDQMSSPRLIDYLMWSFIHWLCLRKSPLMIQMRGFIEEKVALVSQGSLDTSSGLTPVRTRRISSVFIKPRRSMANDSAVSSAASTPRNSTLLNTSWSLPNFNDRSFDASTPRREPSSRLPGYARDLSPISPSGRMARDSGPNIVHLGPVLSPSTSAGLELRRSISASSTQTKGNEITGVVAARGVSVHSTVLVRMTYLRIRLAQTVMGYATLLPMGDAFEGQDDDLSVRAWTKKEALEAVLQEVKDLMEEFRDYKDVEEDSVVEMEDPPASPSKW